MVEEGGDRAGICVACVEEIKNSERNAFYAFATVTIT